MYDGVRLYDHYFMQYVKQVHPSQLDNANKEKSIYIRFHVTLEKAMGIVVKCYKNKLIPNTNVKMLDHALQIAGLTEEIQSQDYLDYHLTWLAGLLKDLLYIHPEEYNTYIDEVLVELRTEQAERVKKYIKNLSANLELTQGQRCKDMANRVAQMDVIPCYIQIFQLYTYCSLWKQHRWENSLVQYEGFMCFAYMFFYKAISRHLAIGKNIKQDIKAFFKSILEEFGGMNNVRTKAELFYKTM